MLVPWRVVSQEVFCSFLTGHRGPKYQTDVIEHFPSGYDVFQTQPPQQVGFVTCLYSP